jgi:Arc/MetJ family transcription regulator
MRTNIEIDERLMRRAMTLTGQSTKKAVVEEALRLTVQLKRQTDALHKLWGIGWEGNLEEMRATRFPDWDKDWKFEPQLRHRSVA